MEDTQLKKEEEEKKKKQNPTSSISKGMLKTEGFLTISKVKRQPSEWEKIIANEATDEQLI